MMTLTTNSKNNGTIAVTAETVADILQRELNHLIHDWMILVEKQQDLMAVSLSYEDRTGHLPKLLDDVIARLRLDAGTKAPLSIAATRHAHLRREQGYSVAWSLRNHVFCRFPFLQLYTRIRTTSTSTSYFPMWSPLRTKLMHN